MSTEKDPEYTGGSVSYYSVPVINPTSKGPEYIAECNDIIEALGMNYAEGNVFKAIWRMCAARKGLGKRGYTDGLYDAEKVVFFGERLIQQYKFSLTEVKQSDKITNSAQQAANKLNEGGSNEVRQKCRIKDGDSYMDVPCRFPNCTCDIKPEYK